jgi:phosphomannomutase
MWSSYTAQDFKPLFFWSLNVSELIISVSGLRGIVGESLTGEVATGYVQAFSSHLPPGPLVLTRDGRANGPPLADIIKSGLSWTGRDVLDAGIAATPTTGVLVRESGSAGGIQITASHNPAPYNGMKLFAGDGRVVPADIGDAVRQTYLDRSVAAEGSQRKGIVTAYGDTTLAHWEKIAAQVNVDKIRAAQVRVLLDANHGSGSILGQCLLEKLGCEVILRGGTADGYFAHAPEPTEENLAELSAEVPAEGVDVGFCQDPDADRLAVIDAQGRYLGEEYTLALCVDHLLRKRKGAVVTNCSTSRMSEDLALRYGVPFSRSAVGEANVVDQMLATEAMIGGEGNGGVIDPRVGLVRDSFIGMAYLLEAMVTRQMSIGDLAAEMPRYEMSKRKLTFPGDRLAEGQAAVRKHFADAAATQPDGLRLDWKDRWLLLRASNTEPIIRIMSEAADQPEADRLCHEAEKVLRNL